MSGLSLDFIIHPGEYLEEAMQEAGLSQEELACRSGVSAKHISSVLNGKSPITVNFARKLSYALKQDAEYWINHQKAYDMELAQYEEVHNITNEEKEIVKKLSQVIKFLQEKGFVALKQATDELVLSLRHLFRISNLCDIPKLKACAAFRKQKSDSTDVYLLYAWQRVCELLSRNNNLYSYDYETQRQMLNERIPDIKKCMFLDQKEMLDKLTSIFAECGISFCIVPAFQGVPVQGFIEKKQDDNVILCMTFRKKRADIFWFTLFHEIGHFINGDVKQSLLDFESSENKMEAKADLFASKNLLSESAYAGFVSENDFSMESINQFSRLQDVMPFVVIGRLQKDEKIGWQKFQDFIPKYSM